MAPEPDKAAATLKPRRRRHPAKRARALALAMSVAATGGIGSAMAAADATGATELRALEPPAASQVTLATSSSGPEASGRTRAGYWDGVWLGTAEYTQWGDVQVQVSISNGEIIDIESTQMPDDRISRRINNAAQPTLETQAIFIQGADLDIVSGATYTSDTYADSLQAALDRAAAGSNEAAEGRAEATAL